MRYASADDAPRYDGSMPHDDGPLVRALEKVGDRWSLQVVEALMAGPLRFNDLRDQLAVAPNILSQRLKQLEGAGILASSPYSTKPVRLTYELTSRGKALTDTITALSAWGAGDEADLSHPVCGTTLQARWYCPTCRTTVEREENLRFV